MATCVYPQTYGPKLADVVEQWGKKILDHVRAQIGDLYPPLRLKGKREARQLVFAGEGIRRGRSAPVRTHRIPVDSNRTCVNRDCGATVPLVRQTWLCRKEGRTIALKMVPDRRAKRVRFEIVSTTSEEKLGFDPAAFSERGDAQCPLCGAAVDADKVKEYGKRGRIGTQLMAVVGTVEGERGRAYLPAESAVMPSEALLEKRLAAFGDEWPGPARLGLPEDARNFWVTSMAWTSTGSCSPTGRPSRC